MGAWGYYDDENDFILDTFYDIIDKYTDTRPISGDVLFRKYKENSRIFYKEIFQGLSGLQLIGIGIFIAKILNKDEIQVQPLHGIPPPSSLPSKLPSDFPKNIREMIIKEIKYALGGKIVEKRKVALEQELYLFSLGKEGKRGSILQNSFSQK